MVVDTDSYDVLLGLDFLIKIRAIVDVEQGLIQIRHGPRANVEVLPLTMVNLLRKMKSKTLMQDAIIVLKNTHISDDCDIANWVPNQDNHVMPKGVATLTLDSNTNTSSNEHYDGGPHQVKQFDDEDEFRDIAFEDLIMSKGPQQVLQLIL
jgi:hypothetical protein